MKKLRQIFFIIFSAIISCLFFTHASAQAPGIQWQKSMGGVADDQAKDIAPTADGGYIIAGLSYSVNGDVTGNHGNYDYWVVKVNAGGSIQWQKCYGGSNDDEANSIRQTTDGGYIIAGISNSEDGDVTGNHGNYDYWIVKTNDTGGIQWQRSLGGSANESAFCIRQTTGGGYIVAGWSNSDDGDVTGNHGSSDYWIVKLSAAGNISWQRSYGGSNDETAVSIAQTLDGGYIAAGISSSSNGDVTGNHGDIDYWVIKTDNAGTLQWQKSLGGSARDVAWSVQQTADSGYIVGGSSFSNDGDVTGNHGNSDYWLTKLSPAGSLQWQKAFGGTGDDEALCVRQAHDGGYIVSGYSSSNDGDVTGNHGDYDYWLLKLSASADIIQWQKSIGGTGDDKAFTTMQTQDSGYITAGYSRSNDGDVTGNHGSNDFFIVKLDATSAVAVITRSAAVAILPNPTTGYIYVTGTSNSTIEVCDITGHLVKKAVRTSNSSISGLPAGMYLIKVFDERGKLLKQDKIQKL